MWGITRPAAVAPITVLCLLIAQPSDAEDVFGARLDGYNTLPPTFSDATGTFVARTAENKLKYRLSYESLAEAPAQVRLHYGHPNSDGGAAVFLCANVEGAPEGTPACPEPPASFIGTIVHKGRHRTSIGAGRNQGPFDYDDLIDAMKAGFVYVEATQGDSGQDATLRGHVHYLPFVQAE